MARFEGAALLLLGLGTVWFALGDGYWALLNPKFRPVTLITGGSLVLLGLLHGLRGHSHRRIGTCLLMMLVATALWGWNLQPWWLPVADGTAELNPTVEDFFPLETSRLSYQDREYIKINLGELYLMHDGTEKSPDSRAWVFRGRVRISDELATKNLMAVTRPAMNCCLADAIEIGFLVTPGNEQAFKDGDWVQVFGSITDLPPEEQQDRPPGIKSKYPLVVQPRFLVVADHIQPTSAPEMTFMFSYSDNEPFFY